VTTEDNKEERRKRIEGILTTLKEDIEKQKIKTQRQIETRESQIDQNRKDFDDFVESQNAINDRTVKAIEFIHTLLFGPEAKSLPSYMLGLEETQEHRDRPEVGMFSGGT
jgi:hypothetical protein